MSMSIASKNVMLDAVGAVAVFASVHDAPPGDSGASEISGGTPAYARKPISWDAAASGKKNKDASDPIFDIPAGTDVQFIGLWSAVTAGTFYGWMPISGGDVAGVACANESDNVSTAVANGLADNDRVVLQKAYDKAMPSGLSENVIYFVISATADTFKLSATEGGPEIDITVSSEYRFQKVVNQQFNVQGTLTLDTAQLDLIV